MRLLADEQPDKHKNPLLNALIRTSSIKGCHNERKSEGEC